MPSRKDHKKQRRSHSSKTETNERGHRKRRDENVTAPKKFKISSFNDTIITTKRLTVGVKGIFGHAKSSSSVYRDLIDRIENKKLSKSSTSEIEESLLHILPGNNSRRSKQSDEYRTPGVKRNTPSSTSVTWSGNHLNSGSISRGISSLETPVRDTYKAIAESLQARIPLLKVFKDWDQLKDIKKQLKKTHESNCPLNLTAKFQADDFMRGSCERPSNKRQKIETKENKPPPMEMLCDVTNIPRSSARGNHKHHTRVEANCPDYPLNVLRTNELHTVYNQDFKTLDCDVVLPFPNFVNRQKNAIVQQPISSEELLKQPMASLRHKNAIVQQPISSEELLKQPMASLRNKNAIVQQPISSGELLKQPMASLRNKRTVNRKAEVFSRKEESSDILDFIDSIPLGALETKLLGDNNNALLSTELVKPSLASPSPPKYYRMSMF